MHTINSRADVEALRGSPQFEAMLRNIYGSMTQWDRVGGEWVAREDLSSISRLGYSKAEFLAEIAPFDFPAHQPPTEPEPQPAPSLAPLTSRQLRLGLVGGGVMPAQVDAAIAAITDDVARAVAEIEWEYASQFERDHPLIEQVGMALGLSVEQIDTMWQAALAA